MKIWQRHLFGRVATTFFFFLFCLFIIYIVVDLSVHGVRFISSNHSTTLQLTLYFLHTFASLLELFVSLTFLLATIRVLFDLNVHRELIALQMAGISKKRLLAPGFIFASFLSAICLINSLCFARTSQEYVSSFRNIHKKKKKIEIYSISLEDKSELVYQSFDETNQELTDVFWVKTADDFWHMSALQRKTLIGKDVHHFKRNAMNQIEKSESFTSRDFSELAWDGHLPKSDNQNGSSQLFYTCVVAFMPFFILLGTSPTTLKFSRVQPFLLFTALALFGLLSFKVIIDGMAILSENQVLSPWIAFGFPLIIALSFILPPFARMR